MQSSQSSQHAKKLQRGREGEKDTEGKVVEQKSALHQISTSRFTSLIVGRVDPVPVKPA